MNSNVTELPQIALRINFKFKSINLFELDVSDTEPVGELRSIISDHPFLKLHPNFKMIHSGVRVNEIQSIEKQMSISEPNMTFDLHLDFLTTQLAERQVHQCADFFMHPEYFLNEGFIDFNILLGKSDFLQNMINKQEMISVEVGLEDIIENNIQKLAKLTFLKSESQSSRFFNSLCYSRFNPASSWMVLQEDFFYLDLITKEGKYYCISANKKGFFTNDSTETNFNQKTNSPHYLSLIDLMMSISPGFKNDLDTIVRLDDQEIHDNFMNSPQIVKAPNDPKTSFSPTQTITTWACSLIQLKETFSDFKNGTNVKVYRDWNEEFQSYRSLPVQDTMQQIQKTKILRKVFKDFSKSAQEISKAIVNNQFSPVNPTDKKAEECYVFNNFFITYAEDKLDWETPRSETTPSTYSNINSDLKNLQQIYCYDLPNVNVINTCAIDFLGLRLVIQTMITGILHFDQKTWNCYGSIDDGKTFNDNQEFAPIFDDLCKVFRLKTNNVFKDASGKQYTIHGSPEVKGIKAGDGRKYVMDLMKLSPRDLNFSRHKEDEGCLIRPELIRNYFFINNIEEICMKNTQMATSLKNESERKGDEESQTPEDSKPEIPEPTTPTQVETKKSKMEYLNPNIGSMIENEDDGLKSVETEQLKAISTFIIENAIPFFKSELASNPAAVPIDMESLIELLHKYGINARYLGRIWSSLDGPNEKFFKLLFERAIIVRSLRKYFRKHALNLSVNELLNVIVHFLNCILGDAEIRSYIDLKSGSTKTNGINSKSVNENAQNSNQKLQKRKNKKKKNTAKVGVLTETTCEQLKMSSSEIFQEIMSIAKTRYGADFSKYTKFEDFLCFSIPKEKVSMLREVCRSMGIVLVARQYNFSMPQTGFEYPIRFKDILGVEPKIKCPNFQIEGLKFSYKNIENEMNEKNFDGALTLLIGCQNLVINTYGIFNTDFIYVSTKMATLYFIKGQIDKAIRIQTLVAKVCERVYGIDHFHTGYAIIELSNYVYEGRKFDSTVVLHCLAILIFDLVGGSLNPSSSLCLQEIHLLYGQVKKPNLSSDAMEELLKRHEMIFGETDERLLFLLGKLASLKGDLGHFKEASILQARKSFILKKVLKHNINENNEYARKIIDEKITDSEFVKNVFVQKSKEIENMGSQDQADSKVKKLKNGKK